MNSRRDSSRAAVPGRVRADGHPTAAMLDHMLLVLFGPPAVGKMTIGRRVAGASSFRLFHNHMTIEPLMETFEYGSPPFRILNREFRRRVLEEAARHEIDLIFSVVWALDSQDDVEEMESYVGIFEETVFVELRADLKTRLVRNTTEERLLHKASKRDVEWSERNLRQMEVDWRMTSADGDHVAAPLLARHPHLVLETADLSPDAAAGRIIEWVAAIRGGRGDR